MKERVFRASYKHTNLWHSEILKAFCNVRTLRMGNKVSFSHNVFNFNYNNNNIVGRVEIFVLHSFFYI